MSQAFPIPRSDRRVDLTATASQTVFTFPYPALQNQDVSVAVKAAGGTQFAALTYGSDYTVAGAPSSSSVIVTLTTPAAAGAVYRLTGARVPSRTTSLAPYGTAYRTALDTELDNITLVLQELRRDFGLLEDFANNNPAITPIDATDVYFTQAGASAISRNIALRLQEEVTVTDFMSAAQIVDVVTGAETLDHTTAVQAAINAAVGKKLRWPKGTYSVTKLTGVSNTAWQGVGVAGTIIKKRGVVAGDLVEFYPLSSWFGIYDIQFDGGDISNATAYSNLTIREGANFAIERCRFIKFDKLAIGINAGRYGYINNNYFERTTSSPQGVNQSILIGTSAGASNNITISNNVCRKAGIISVGHYISFINNNITGWQYGAGISTSTNGSSNFNLIMGNYCSSGTGIDSDILDLKGIESWGHYARIIGNTCVSCSGPGILVGGPFSVVNGNFCLNNNTYGTALGAGIAAVYFDAVNNALNSMIANNICWDTSGGSGTQDYGIVADYRLDNLSIVDNQVYQNKLGEYFIYNGLAAAENTAISFRGKTYTKSFTWDAASIANGASLTNSQTVAYARLGDFVQASCSITQAGLTLSAYVSGVNAVVIVLTNNTGGAVDLASAKFRVFGQQALY